MQRRSRDLRPRGSPPITRITLPTCRSHYPDGSNGCMCRLLPRPPGLPRCSGGSASISSLSRPAQALLTLRPAGSLNRPKAAFVTRLRPGQSPSQTARQLPDQSTTLWVESSSTGETRLRNAQYKKATLGDRALFEEKIAKLTGQLDAESAARLFAEGALRSARQERSARRQEGHDVAAESPSSETKSADSKVTWLRR